MTAHMVPALPCADLEATAEFLTALGFEITYSQTRPNPYLAARREGLDLHYYGLPELKPEDSHSSCLIVVDDTEPLFDAFAAGLREQYGSIPLRGVPRITRPRRRKNANNLSGFSLVDPSGNWIRVVLAEPDATVLAEGEAAAAGAAGAAADAATRRGAGAAASAPAAPAPPAPAPSAPAPVPAPPRSRLAQAHANAVVHADSHGNNAQALKVLAAALDRHGEAATAVERVESLAYLAELCVRTADREGARAALKDLATVKLTKAQRAEAQAALAQAAEIADSLRVRKAHSHGG